VTGAQCIAARLLLGWGQRTLAEKAEVAPTTLMYFEKGMRETHPRTVAAIQAVLESAGVSISEGAAGGPGVEMKEIRLSDGSSVWLSES